MDLDYLRVLQNPLPRHGSTPLPLQGPIPLTWIANRKCVSTAGRAQSKKKGKKPRRRPETSLDEHDQHRCADHDLTDGGYPTVPQLPETCQSCSDQTLFTVRLSEEEVANVLWYFIVQTLREGKKPIQSCLNETICPLDTQMCAMRTDLVHRYLHVPASNLKYTTNHASCQLRSCCVKRASMFDTLMQSDRRTVLTRIHIQPELLGGVRIRAIRMDLSLHVSFDDQTGAEYICAQEVVRSFFPNFFASVTKLMHSLYTLNHAYGRGSPYEVNVFGADDPDCPLHPKTWMHWVGCPQELQNRKPSQDHTTRIWLGQGVAEIAFGAECEPDANTIAPAVIEPLDSRSKGKNRA